MSGTKRWLITGGCGFIGTQLIAKLLKDYPGIYIRVLDNLIIGTRNDLANVCKFSEIDSKMIADPNDKTNEVQLVVGDIQDVSVCEACAKGTDIIIHIAASTGVPLSVENPRTDMEANIVGTFNMLEAARLYNVKRFVFASSGAPIGEVEPPIHEELAPHPVSPYGASKLAGEGYCSAYFRSFGITTVALRFGNVYGPGSKHKSSVVAKFIKQAFAGDTIEIYGTGKQTRDFIFIDDLIKAIILASRKKDIGGETFQIATNSETTVNEIFLRLQNILNTRGLTKIDTVNVKPRIGDVDRNFSNTQKAMRILGWKNSTDLEEGLKKTVDWFIATQFGTK